MYKSLFTVPDGSPLTRPVVALPISELATAAGVRFGDVPSSSAAAPATCGDAIDVPLIVAVAVADPIQSDVMPDPGA